ncbi:MULTISPECIES: hypothetical protein [unclassified Rhodanobacter]|uniref:hypothetical protein n=1 Tax=unclassified Rhodanobacter TaxID=2621553 RepID=UPI000AA9C730|nr:MULTISPECIES: hypothetical protein [unclassified Rhodanobacter]
MAYAVVRWYRHPMLRIEALLKGENEESIEFEVLARNLGRLNFATNEIYWHIFVDDRIEIAASTQEPEFDKQIVAGNTMKHFSGAIDGALFPNRPWNLLRMTVKRPNANGLGLHYFISTAYGQFPIFLRRLNNGESRQQNLPRFAEINSSGLVKL